jgi:hypothetical protein
MQYALMIYAEPGYVHALPDAEREAERAELLALARRPPVHRQHGCSRARRLRACRWSVAGR